MPSPHSWQLSGNGGADLLDSPHVGPADATNAGRTLQASSPPAPAAVKAAVIRDATSPPGMVKPTLVVETGNMSTVMPGTPTYILAGLGGITSDGKVLPAP
jgi:hypothetical protein